MPKDPDVLSGEVIESVWGNQTVRDKLVQRATNAADLAASWPNPGDGETVWQQDTDQLWVWNGTEWREAVFIIAGVVTLDELVVNGDVDVTGDVTGDRFLADNGTVGSPGYSFTDELDLGIRRITPTGGMALVAGGSDQITVDPGGVDVSSRLTAQAGSAADVGIQIGSFNINDGLFSPAVNQITLQAGGNEMLRVRGDGTVRTYMQQIYHDQTANTPNVRVGTDGRLQFSTSAAVARSVFDALEARVAALEA